MTIKTKLTNY